jgi:uncharacterized small protein (DUF1192 family)
VGAEVSAEQKDMTIAGLVRQIDENRERIGTLTAENARLTRDLVAAEAQRDDANAKVFHHTRRGW